MMIEVCVGGRSNENTQLMISESVMMTLDVGRKSESTSDISISVSENGCKRHDHASISSRVTLQIFAIVAVHLYENYTSSASISDNPSNLQASVH
eukprot:scaffold31436_cov206-Skeletonema_menzelii.AAC.1